MGQLRSASDTRAQFELTASASFSHLYNSRDNGQSHVRDTERIQVAVYMIVGMACFEPGTLHTGAADSRKQLRSNMEQRSKYGEVGRA